MAIVLVGTLARMLPEFRVQWSADLSGSPYVPSVGALAFLQAFSAAVWGSLLRLSFRVRKAALLLAPSLVGFGFLSFFAASSDVGVVDVYLGDKRRPLISTRNSAIPGSARVRGGWQETQMLAVACALRKHVSRRGNKLARW